MTKAVVLVALFVASGIASADKLHIVPAKAAVPVNSTAHAVTSVQAKAPAAVAKTAAVAKPHGQNLLQTVKHALRRNKNLKHPRHSHGAVKQAEVESIDETDPVDDADLDAEPTTDAAEPMAAEKSDDADAINTEAAPEPQPEVQPVQQKPQPQPEVVKVEPVAMDDDDSAVTVASELKQELSESKQRRANVAQLERALAADIALLREGTALRRVSVSRRGRAAAERQVRESETVVKDTGGMLRASREAAAEDARSMLQEAEAVKAESDQMASEAREQLHLFGASTAEVPVAKEPEVPAPRPTKKKVQQKRSEDIDDIDDA